MPLIEAQLETLNLKLDDLFALLSDIRRLSEYVKTAITLPDGTTITLTNAQKAIILNKYDALKALVVAKWTEMP